jgi:hypothetical protein
MSLDMGSADFLRIIHTVHTMKSQLTCVQLLQSLALLVKALFVTYVLLLKYSIHVKYYINNYRYYILLLYSTNTSFDIIGNKFKVDLTYLTCHVFVLFYCALNC